MTCERFREVDAESFLIDAAANEFDSFRTHLFDCATCARSVEEWTAFEGTLREIMDPDRRGVDAHPEPERLEEYATAAGRMGGEGMAIENHLAICRSCRSEVAVIQRFEADFLSVLPGDGAATHLNPSFSSGASSSGFGERIRSWFSSPGVSIPAFALAALIVLGLWSSGVFEARKSATLPEPAPQIVQQAPAPSGSSPQVQPSPIPRTPQTPRIAPEPPTPEALAMGMDPATTDRAKPDGAESAPSMTRIEDAVEELPTPQPAPRTRLAEATAVPEKTRPEGKPSVDPIESLSEAPDEILLAALTELPMPDYAAPPGAGSVGWLRQLGAVRSGSGAARVETRAPQSHAGLALEAAPRLWWSLSEDTSLGVEVMLVDDREIDPVAQIEIAGPLRAGLHSIDLAEHGVSLEPNIEYRWFVSLIVDPDRPSRNPVAGGALRILSDDDPRRAQVLQSPPTERGHTLARLGVWYDAFDFFASISAAHPELTSLVRQRDHLTKTAGAGG